jgi:hypothetical protein
MAEKLDHMEIQRRLELARKPRRVHERNWWMNLAFVEGHHYVRYDLQAGRVIEMDKPYEEIERPVHNYAMKVTRTERAKILKTSPVAEAMPATTSEDDRYIARVLNAQFRQWQEEWKWQRRLRVASYWIVTCGNVWMKWYWNDKARIAVVPPFDMYPDPYAKDFADCRWGIQANFLDVDAAKEIYGVKGSHLDKVVQTQTQDMNAVESRIFANFSDGEVNIPGVVTYEYYERPSKSRPDGAYIVSTKAGVILEEKFPYKHGRLPFTHIGHIVRANSPWYAAVLDYTRDINREINRTEAQILENRNLSNGKWFIPSTLELEADPDARPRQVLKASGGSPETRPEFYQVNGLPSWVGAEPERLAGILHDIAGQHEVSHGGVPGRVESGQAIQLLQETDDSVMKDTIHSLEEGVADGFFMQAQNLRQFGKMDQILKVYDREGRVEVFEFKKDQIPLDFQVRVQTTTGLPQSISGRWDRVLNLWQYKVLTDPNQVLELLDLAPESPDLQANAEDRMYQWREIQQLKQGNPIEPLRTDNHTVHRLELVRFMRTDEYRALPEETQLKFEHHLERHEALELEEATREAERMAAAQGALMAPPPGGDPNAAGGAPLDPNATPQDQIADPMPPPATPEGSPAPVA